MMFNLDDAKQLAKLSNDEILSQIWKVFGNTLRQHIASELLIGDDDQLKIGKNLSKNDFKLCSIAFYKNEHKSASADFDNCVFAKLKLNLDGDELNGRSGDRYIFIRMKFDPAKKAIVPYSKASPAMDLFITLDNVAEFFMTTNLKNVRLTIIINEKK